MKMMGRVLGSREDKKSGTQPCSPAAGLHSGPPPPPVTGGMNWLQWLTASEPQFPCLLNRSNTAGKSLSLG